MNPDPTELQPLEQMLGHEFRDASLLRLALTHPSASGNQSKPPDDNQRMEFLGKDSADKVPRGIQPAVEVQRGDERLERLLPRGLLAALEFSALAAPQHEVLLEAKRGGLGRE